MITIFWAATSIALGYLNPRYGFQVGLRSAAIMVLYNHKLDIDENPEKSPATVVWGVAEVLRSAVFSVPTQLSNTTPLMLSIVAATEVSSARAQVMMRVCTMYLVFSFSRFRFKL